MSTTLSIGRRFLSFVLCLALASVLSLSAYASAADNAIILYRLVSLMTHLIHMRSLLQRARIRN